MSKTELHVGYARTDITPKYSVPLAGYGNNDQRMSQGVQQPMYATCLALADGEKGQPLLIYTVDIVEAKYPAEMRAEIKKATGLPDERILISGTHTHSGPDQDSKVPSAQKWLREYWALLGQTGAAAIADLAPASLLLGQTRTHGMNFVRHYVMEDGSVSGDNFGNHKLTRTAHVAPPDEQVLIAKFVREGKKDILLFNWQAHPKLASTASTPYGKEHRPLISADFVGACRDMVERETGCLFAFCQGAAGNLNPLSAIKSENPPSLEPDAYGEQLAAVFLAGLSSLKPAQTGPVRAAQTLFPAAVDHVDDGRVPQAQKLMDLWAESDDLALVRREGEKVGIQGAYDAEGIVRRSKLGKERIMELDAVSVGDLAFVTAPYEMFCVNGEQIKKGSPFPTTFVLTCANGYFDYIADDLAFTYYSYEVQQRHFVRGIAEALVAAMVDMLKGLR